MSMSYCLQGRMVDKATYDAYVAANPDKKMGFIDATNAHTPEQIERLGLKAYDDVRDSI